MRHTKSFAILLFLAISLPGLAGCGSPTEDQSTAARSETSSTPLPSPTPEPSVDTGMKTAPSGLQYEDLVVGVGPKPFLGQTLLVAYAGYNTKGIKFDSGTLDYRPGKDRMIKGFEMGIIGAKGIEPMREGGKRKLIIPPELGYGDQITGTIPPNSTLIFEIELLKVRNAGMGF
ncbi:MAG: FKBP-type peptidyl-prolyl cis-trans isomerase [Acidobacteriota bacterium]|nr:MAG: FKBP-type peptidyl-prolyl cis-trans isomerase [Acidobacteriota bacterium]